MQNSTARRVDSHFATMYWEFSVLSGRGRVPASVMFSITWGWGSLRRLATALARRGVVFLPGDQQPAECVQVAAQDRQSHVTFEADLRMVAAAFQSITALQRTDRRLHSRVILLSGQEFLVGFRLLNH